MKARHPHPTQWTAVMCGGALIPGEHAMLRKTRAEAEDLVAFFRRDAVTKGEAFVAQILPPSGAAR